MALAVDGQRSIVERRKTKNDSGELRIQCNVADEVDIPCPGSLRVHFAMALMRLAVSFTWITPPDLLMIRRSQLLNAMAPAPRRPRAHDRGEWKALMPLVNQPNG